MKKIYFLLLFERIKNNSAFDCKNGEVEYLGNCYSCPVGYSCSSGEIHACPPGHFSDQNGATSCKICPEGFYDPRENFDDESDFCDYCPTNFECKNGMKKACPIGTYSQFSTSKCLPDIESNCSPGFFLNSERICETCPEGTFSNGKTPECLYCPTGYHVNAQRSECNPCKAGFSCHTNGVVEKCLEGFYSLEFENSCTQCPAGHECPNKAEKPARCREGFFAPPGVIECMMVPEGYSSSDGTVIKRCQNGFKSPLGESKCFKKSQDSTEIHPIKSRGRRAVQVKADCAPGEFFESSLETCLPCPEGSFCVSGNQDPCPANQFSGIGASACTSCTSLENQVCRTSPGKASELDFCDPGEKSGTNSVGKDACEIGFYCPGDCKEYECPTGQYTNARGESSCASCPAGSQCTSTNISPCPGTQVSYVDQISCFACPAGFACPDSNAYNMKECEPGFYSTGNQRTCTACPAGEKCPKIDGSENTSCPSGEFAPSESVTCFAVLPGYEAENVGTGSTSQTKCSEGSYSLGGTERCEQCPLNNYCPDITRRNISCEPGYYQDAVGQTSCKICEAGFACSGGSPKISCPEGFYSYQGQATCSLCSAGYLCTGTGNTQPENSTQACPAGKYCPIDETSGITVEKDCPVGTFQSLTARTSLEDCQICPAGYQCSTTDQFNTAEVCPAGFYCPGMSFTDDFFNELVNTGTGLNYNNPDSAETGSLLLSMQYPCPAGTYSTDTGLTHESQCLICPAGSYCPVVNQGRSQAIICPANHYCPVGHPTANQNPPTCPDGYYSTATGLHTPQQCLPCPVGQYCIAGNGPTACPNGSYRDKTAGASEDDCILTKQGYYQRISDSKDQDATTECPEGYYCPAGTYENFGIPCPVGTYNDVTGISYREECKECPAGRYCDSQGMTSQGQLCSVGHYCPPGTKFEHPCHAGTRALSTGTECQKKSEFAWTNDDSCNNECEICPEKYYCPIGTGDMTGLECPTGHFCPVGTQEQFQYPCPNGTYYDDVANPIADSTDCKKCPDGFWCGLGTTSPDPCPDGRFFTSDPTDLIGARNVEECTLCPAGKYCIIDASNGITSATDCNPGEYSGPGAKSCLPCIAGHFCDGGTSKEKMLSASNTCPAGNFCPVGSIDASLSCQEGYFCPEGTEQMLKCFPGTYNDDKGAASASECKICPAGFFCEAGMTFEPTNDTWMCDEGHYCPDDIVLNPFLTEYDLENDNVQSALNRTIGSYGPKQVECPGGFYRDAKGAKDVSECFSCKPETYCPPGSSAEIPCPQGFYCGDEMEVPIPCPKGTYHNTDNSNFLTSEAECTVCTEGYFCDGEGLFGTATDGPRDKCDPGPDLFYQ